jgi:outer membrane protein TolC
MLRIPIVLSVLLALPLSRAVAQQADPLSSTLLAPVAAVEPAPLTLAEVYALARERSPALRASTAAVEAVRAREGSAKLPPDPELQLGVMTTPFPGVERMSSALQPSMQLMQRVPIGGKLALGARVARQSTEIESATADEAAWRVRGQAAAHFYEIYRLDRQTAVLRETLTWLQSFEQVARAMYAAGQGRQSDVLRASVEVSRMDAEITRMRALRAAAVARLNAVLDRPAATAVPAIAWTPLPLDLPHVDTLAAWAEQSRPRLERGRLAAQQAATRRSLAKRELWPDLALGVQLSRQAGATGGSERMGGVMLGVSLPVFAAQRQLQMRKEAEAMQQMADADLTQSRAEVRASIGEITAELERARTLTALYRREVLPQAEANAQSALAIYRVGGVDFLTLVDAQTTLNQYQQELYALLAEYGVLTAELEMAIGRELPPTSNAVLMEEPR